MRKKRSVMANEFERKEDRRYTQHSGFGDRARSKEQLKEDQIRKPSNSEGLAFREKAD